MADMETLCKDFQSEVSPDGTDSVNEDSDAHEYVPRGGAIGKLFLEWFTRAAVHVVGKRGGPVVTYMCKRPAIYFDNERILRDSGHDDWEIRGRQLQWAMMLVFCGHHVDTYPLSEFVQGRSECNGIGG
jgi:hypothetical protein